MEEKNFFPLFFFSSIICIFMVRHSYGWDNFPSFQFFCSNQIHIHTHTFMRALGKNEINLQCKKKERISSLVMSRNLPSKKDITASIYRALLLFFFKMKFYLYFVKPNSNCRMISKRVSMRASHGNKCCAL